MSFQQNILIVDDKLSNLIALELSLEELDKDELNTNVNVVHSLNGFVNLE